MKKTIIVVCLYNRYENLYKWLHCWPQCQKENTQLFIVHNTEETDTLKWKILCETSGANYIKRQNIGFETGVIQDVLLGRMFNETNWNNVIFFTDDTIPMSQWFIDDFIHPLNRKNVGVTCMQMSGVFTPHIRTTGFALTKETAKRIVFTTVQIQSKDDCYFFEHQGGEFTLLSQILRMGKLVFQLDIIEDSPVWDTHHNSYLNRWDEWNKEFPGFY